MLRNLDSEQLGIRHAANVFSKRRPWERQNVSAIEEQQKQIYRSRESYVSFHNS